MGRGKVIPLKPKQVEDICIGKIAKHMGMHLPINSINAAKEVTQFFASLTHREMKLLKEHYRNLETQKNSSTNEAS